uniref:HAUS augmin-like complex subunit 6 N-terminal domain-containing protein n=1 Tax=Anopheles atroparvus TaxID=41427 RepID=A0AAG5CZ66_ANOAO
MSVTVVQGKTVGVHRAKTAVARKSARFNRKRKSLRAPPRLIKPRFGMSKKVTVKRAISQTLLANVTQANASQASRCEEQLDEAIYRCLHSLTKRHEPTKEFKAQFSRGAFLKPNTKAFIQVMHFLFNIYDAREFQKRFYWPIFDKAAENAFRTSTVEYVNSLIERGKLVGIPKIKAHVVVLPGGVKFMKFLLCIIRLVLQEEVRKAKAGSASADGEVLTKKRIAQMIDCHKRWVQAGNQIHAIVKEEVALLSRNTEKIEHLIEMILTGSELAKTMSYDKLMQLWAVLIKSQFKEREKLQQRTLAIAMEFQKIIEKAEAKMRSNELQLPFATEQLQDSLNNAARQNSDWVPIAKEVFDENGKLNPIKLVQVFDLALPSVEQFFRNFCFKNQEVMKYEQKELSKVVVKLDNVRQQMDVLQRNLPILDDCLLRDVHGNDGSPEVAKCENFAIKNKLFSTPPIVMDFEGHSDDATAGTSSAGRGSQRLALLNKEDVQLMNARMKLLSTSLYQPRSPRVPRTQSKMPSDQNQSSPNAFAVPRVARKEKLNPLTMLNRIKAQSQKHPTGSASKIGTSAPVNSTMNISALSEITLRPEFSSTLLGTPEKPAIPVTTDANKAIEREKVAANLLQVPVQGSQHLHVNRVRNSPSIHSHSSPRLMAIYVGSTETPKSRRSSSSILLAAGAGGRNTAATKRNSLVDNVSVHTSPSGRLESVFKQNELMPPSEIRLVPEKEERGAVATDGGDAADTSDEKTLKPEEGGQLVDLSRTLLATSLDSQATLVPAYHHEPEGTNSTQEQQDQPYNEEAEEDYLFNVSDGILTDFE